MWRIATLFNLPKCPWINEWIKNHNSSCFIQWENERNKRNHPGEWYKPEQEYQGANAFSQVGNPPGKGIKVERGLRTERDEQEGREETQVYTVKICYSGWFNKKLIDQ